MNPLMRLVAIFLSLLLPTTPFVYAKEPERVLIPLHTVSRTDSPTVESVFSVEKIALSEPKNGQPLSNIDPPQPVQIVVKPKIQVAVKPSPSKKYDSKVKIIGYSSLQCVVYVHRVGNLPKVTGYAGDLVPEGYIPKVGAAALEKNYGHVSIVVAIIGNTLVLHDTNWVKGAITERVVPMSAERGYIY